MYNKTNMTIQAENNYLVLEKYEVSKPDTFLSADTKPTNVFRVLETESIEYIVGDLVVPKPSELISMEIDDELYFFVHEDAVMGKLDASN